MAFFLLTVVLGLRDCGAIEVIPEIGIADGYLMVICDLKCGLLVAGISTKYKAIFFFFY